MIDTTNEKLSLMEGEVWEPGLPLSPSTLGQDDRQQLLWGYPGILWEEAAAPVPFNLGDAVTVSLTPVRRTKRLP